MDTPRMRIWLLLPREDLPDTPLHPWRKYEEYWKAHGFVVRAATEEDARKLANDAGGEENEVRRHEGQWNMAPWLDAALTTCEELTGEGPAEVILRDYLQG